MAAPTRAPPRIVAEATLADISLRHPAAPLAGHLAETVKLAAPMALALAAQVAMGVITAIALGGIGDSALAAGALATTIVTTALLVLQGSLSGVGVLAAEHTGAGRDDDIGKVFWSGIALALMLSLPLVALLGLSAPLLRAAGEPAALAAAVGRYMHILRWAIPPGALGIGLLRQFLPAVGLQHMLVRIMPLTLALHVGLNVVLIHGMPGLPPLGVTGSALATVISIGFMAVAMAAGLHRRGQLAPVRPVAGQLRRLLALGLPGAGIIAVESGLFLATGILAGRLGSAVLAAHMIAVSVTSLFFVVPLALGQAANVRVAIASGAGRPDDIRRAGQAAILLGVVFMASSALLLSIAPGWFARLYLGPAAALDPATIPLARRLLRIAGLFQLVDGVQVTTAGALRGMQDVQVPMLLAAFGYWAVGFPAGWELAFRAGLGAAGLWWGLFTGLAAVALTLALRFAKLTQRGARG